MGYGEDRRQWPGISEEDQRQLSERLHRGGVGRLVTYRVNGCVQLFVERS